MPPMTAIENPIKNSNIVALKCSIKSGCQFAKIIDTTPVGAGMIKLGTILDRTSHSTIASTMIENPINKL